MQMEKQVGVQNDTLQHPPYFNRLLPHQDSHCKRKSNEVWRMCNQEGDLPAKLAAPAHCTLTRTGIHNLEQLAKNYEGLVKTLHGIGPNVLSQLHQTLDAKGDR